ncbi:hypothetical protein V6N13_133301 [Hibiscus sabdariffa]|uniref:Uncharacterized protein n=1 Tax=Hibiscus sabdariffa TaxID=183260 RepID=A0ABR2CIF5_9ROSI
MQLLGSVSVVMDACKRCFLIASAFLVICFDGLGTLVCCFQGEELIETMADEVIHHIDSPHFTTRQGICNVEELEDADD